MITEPQTLEKILAQAKQLSPEYRLRLIQRIIQTLSTLEDFAIAEWWPNDKERTVQMGHSLALALGQNPELLARIEQGELHPAMAAFGLWRDEDDLANLADEIAANRQNQIDRPALSL